VSDLHTTVVGAGPPDYVFCHGLFGQGRNWRGVARRLLPASSLLVDLPNHGASPWTEAVSYPLMAQAVAGLLAEAAGPEVTLVGHSMGGRVAMLTALIDPALVGRLVVVDIAPVRRPLPTVAAATAALQRLGPGDLTDRQRADQALAASLPDPSLRSFLLTGYRFTPPVGWRFNLDLLARHLDLIEDWPSLKLSPYSGPVLWLAGGQSDYIRPADQPVMAALFPRYRLQVIPQAGHWVQADQPAAVAQALRQFRTTSPLA